MSYEKSAENQLNVSVKGVGQPIIVMHGLFGAKDNLGRLATLLASEFEVHSLDMPNHGESFRSEYMSYDMMAEAVKSYLDACNFEKVKAFGHSMGGKVAMRLALNFPDRIEKVVVGDIAPVDYSAHHTEIFAGLDAIDLDSLHSRKEADQTMSAHVNEQSVRQFLLKNLKRAQDGTYEWKMNLVAIKNNYKNILSGLEASQPYTNPILFIAGGESDYILPEYRSKTLSLFPNAQVKVIPGTSHWLHAEKPDLFNSICLKFFRE